MIRESDKANAPFLFIGASPQKVVLCQRDNKGELVCEKGADVYQDKPVFLKFDKQKENQFVPAYSFDDKNWTPFQAYAFSTNAQILVGFAISSGNSSNRVKVRFLDVSSKSDSATEK